MASKADGDAPTVKLYDFLEGMEDAVRQKLEGSKELNIAIIGPYHVGKSTLINAMFKNAVKAPVAQKKAPCTQKAKGYTIIPQGTNVKVTIYDSRGLQDGEGEDKMYLKDMKQACPNIHLIIYCTKLREPVRPEEEKALKNLTIHFKEKLKNAIIALTFANEVEPPDLDTDEVKYFENELELKKKALNECFTKLKIHRYLEGIENRMYPVGSARKQKLPTDKIWLSEFWMGCLDHCDVEAKPALFLSGFSFFIVFSIRIALGIVFGPIMGHKVATEWLEINPKEFSDPYIKSDL